MWNKVSIRGVPFMKANLYYRRSKNVTSLLKFPNSGRRRLSVAGLKLGIGYYPGQISRIVTVIGLSIVCLILSGLLVACADKSAPGAVPNATDSTVKDESSSFSEVGEGSTHFIFKLIDADGESKLMRVHTDAATVGDALTALGLIAGEKSEYGLMVNTVCGLSADYEKDKAYWAFFVEGEYASAGVDATEIEKGAVYSFVYTRE